MTPAPTPAPAPHPSPPDGVPATRICSNVWHGALVGAERVPAAAGSQLAAVLGAVRLFRRCRDAAALVTSEGTLRPVGLSVYALLLRLTGRRNLVLVEFLPGRKRGLTGALVEAAYRLLLGRVCCGVQVMTAWEREEYRRRYRFAPEAVEHIPFYHLDDRDPEPPVPTARRRGILASGRNSCDWPTLVEAAEGQAWDLTIICGAADLPSIQGPAAAAGVRVLSDVPRPEHDRRLAEAVLFLAVLKDQGGSSGHVRLASAAARRTPVIASAIPGLQGYDQLAVQTVPPEDPAALRAAVNAALADPVEVERREAVVLDRARRRPYGAYTAEVAEFLTRCVPPG